MSKTQSPFAALTNEQKQWKWMEYQSIRLPYTEAALTRPPEKPDCTEKIEPTTDAAAAPNTAQQLSASKVAPVSGRPLPPPEVYMQGKPAGLPRGNEAQKMRHHQYDAVIARMKQAEMRTGSYCRWSE